MVGQSNVRLDAQEGDMLVKFAPNSYSKALFCAKSDPRNVIASVAGLVRN